MEYSFKLSVNTPEGKKILQDIALREIINAPQEELEEPYTTNEKARDDYFQMLVIAREIEKRGLCTCEYHNALKPYELHSLYITWIYDEDDPFIDVPIREIEKILSLADDFMISAEGERFWQISKKIYS